MQCRCGCGTEIPQVSRSTLYRLKQGKSVGYLPGHANKGDKNVRWKGGRHITGQGYVRVLVPSHANASRSGYLLEHRFVMSTHIGRPLLATEIVHHVNGIKTDNRIENLVITKRSTHATVHGTQRKGEQRVPRVSVVCIGCGVEFTTLPGTPARKRRQYCTKQCEKQNQYGEQAKHCKFSNAQIEQIRALRGSMTNPSLAEKFGVSVTQLKRFFNGTRSG